MQNKTESTREQARQILKDGILDMSVERLIQMSKFGLMGSIFITNGLTFSNNMFNQIDYDEEDNIMTFSIGESEGNYGEISFYVDAISQISGCEDEENPDEYLHVNIKLKRLMHILNLISYKIGDFCPLFLC